MTRPPKLTARPQAATPGYPWRRVYSRALRIAARGAAVVLLGACAASAETASTTRPAAEETPEVHAADAPVLAESDARIGPRDTVDPREFRTSGVIASPSVADLQHALRGSMDALTVCYEHAIAENPGLEGRIVADLECVNGRCISVHVVEDGVGSPPLSACITGVLTGLRFNPRPDSVTVRLPLAFAPPSAPPPDAGAPTE